MYLSSAEVRPVWQPQLPLAKKVLALSLPTAPRLSLINPVEKA